MRNERESLERYNRDFCFSFQLYYSFLQQSMGGCVNKTAEVQISPQHYRRKVKSLRDSRKWCRQLPTKSAEESENMMTCTSIINLKEVVPDAQGPQSEQQWVEMCLQATKGRIIRKQPKLLPQRYNEHMAVISNSGAKSKRAERKDVNLKVNSQVAEIEFENNHSCKNRKITVNSIEGFQSTADNLDGSPKRRKPTKGMSTKMNEKENLHKERVYLDHKLHHSSDGSIPQLAVNVQKSNSFQTQDEIQDFVIQSTEIIADSSNQVVDYSHICLRNQVSNFEFILPQSQAGPLIVSILDYARYQV